MSNENKALKHPVRTIILIIIIALVVGGAGSAGLIYFKQSKQPDKPVMEAPIIDEISSAKDTDQSTAASDNIDAVPTSFASDISNRSVSTSDVSAIVEAVIPAVVSIDCTTTYTYYSWFGMPSSEDAISSGTGFIIACTDDKIFIATNNHVIENASSIDVSFVDDSSASAELVGTDTYYDLAVISVNVDSLESETLDAIRIASIGDSKKVEIGDLTVAIGNALGYGQSTTVGYVSALDRDVTVEGITKPLIQTDTAINPGNSGGPLLNIYGQVIGINSVKYANEGVEGMGYAIPMADAIPIINELIQYETLEESEIGYLGIEGKDISSAYATGFGMPMGIYVYDIAEGSPASESELCVGDIITEINGRSVKSMEEFKNRISHIRAGETITLTVNTLEGGRYVEHTIDIRLAHRPKSN